MQLGPLSKVMGMFPGMSADMFPKGAEEDTSRWFKKMLCMMDSMTAEGQYALLNDLYFLRMPPPCLYTIVDPKYELQLRFQNIN
jgi:hypothetical protein